MTTMLTIVGVLAVCIIILLLLFACCKVAADADRQSERDYARFNCAAGMGVSLATTRHGRNTSPFRAIRQRAARIASCSSAKAIPPFWMDSSA